MKKIITNHEGSIADSKDADKPYFVFHIGPPKTGKQFDNKSNHSVLIEQCSEFDDGSPSSLTFTHRKPPRKIKQPRRYKRICSNFATRLRKMLTTVVDAFITPFLKPEIRNILSAGKKILSYTYHRYCSNARLLAIGRMMKSYSLC